jgi:hypothetical protein
MKRIASLLVGLALMLSVPGAAMANSSCQAYNGQNTCQPTTTTPPEPPTLPFTGLDVALLLAGGGVLVGAGLVVRRVARRIE